MIGKIIRWVFAITCVAAGIWLVINALKSGEVAAAAAGGTGMEHDESMAGHFAIGATPRFVLAAAAFLIGLFLLSPETVGQLAGMIGQFFTNFLFPEARNSKPGLTYTLARFYVQEERFAEAVVEYQKIIRYYPDERDAYTELLAAAAQNGDTKTYNKYARILKRRFNCELEVVYDEPVVREETVTETGEEPPRDQPREGQPPA